MISPRRVLVLAPHTDDAELGCGGTMARWIDEGADISIAVFSTAEKSLPPGSKRYRLRDECHQALDELKVPETNRFIYEYPVRELGYHRQEVLEQMIVLARDVDPEVILVPSGADLHQDHEVVYRESLRAFRHLTIMGYEMPWNHITFSTHAFVVLTEEHLHRKWAALTKYVSQIEVARPYFRYEAIEAMARVRGLQVKTDFAEAYELIRMKL
ncbi:PIG-L deacetylase family protein [Actinomycetospora rhizophila]|uniref:PIG-L deacetylase family protein n=1 Tax=Actinomycetospora rhizophila TaxID=1416876 RepID=A0ABV9ZKD8_9PSEU